MNCSAIYDYDEQSLIMLATIAISWLMVAIFGFFTNLLVLVAVVKSTLLRHHPATNIFIISLCSSHLLTCVSICWDIYTMFCHFDTWLQCRYDGLGTLSAIGTSMFNTGAIAFSRLLLVTRPDHYNWLFTRFKMAVMIIAFWVLPPMAACIISETQHLSQFVNGTCSDHTVTPRYYRALAALYYPIPTVVTVFSYGLIYRHIHSHFNRQQSQVSPPRGLNCTSPASSLSPNSTSASTNDIHRRRCKAKNEIVTNIFFPIFATIIFSLPLCATLAIGETAYIKFTITIYLCNLGVAPVVYGLKNPQLKVAIGRLLNCQCPQKPQGCNSTTVNMSTFSRNRNVEAITQ